MRFLTKLFGVSWATHQKTLNELAASRMLHETAAKARRSELGLRKKAEERLSELHSEYDRIKVVHRANEDELAEVKPRAELAERQVAEAHEVNQKLAQEIQRIGELFMTPFASDEAKALALRSRELWRRHLQRPTGVRKRYVSRDVVLGVEVAMQDVERRAMENAQAAAEMPKAPGQI